MGDEILVGRTLETFFMAHQCHDVIGQVPSQIRGYETREASKGDTCVILVGTAEVLDKQRVKIEIVHKGQKRMAER